MLVFGVSRIRGLFMMVLGRGYMCLEWEDYLIIGVFLFVSWLDCCRLCIC